MLSSLHFEGSYITCIPSNSYTSTLIVPKPQRKTSEELFEYHKKCRNNRHKKIKHDVRPHVYFLQNFYGATYSIETSKVSKIPIFLCLFYSKRFVLGIQTYFSKKIETINSHKKRPNSKGTNLLIERKKERRETKEKHILLESQDVCTNSSNPEGPDRKSTGQRRCICIHPDTRPVPFSFPLPTLLRTLEARARRPRLRDGAARPAA
jgi:hypothetical protein